MANYLYSISVPDTNVLAYIKIQCDLQLFDMDPDVYLQLRKMRGFHHSDGFEEIKSGLLADLYFVYPAYCENTESDWMRVREVIKKFRERTAKALIWYPVLGNNRLKNLAGVVIAEV
jgi:23S rRNA A2030 N6-methylase RlmJ